MGEQSIRIVAIPGSIRPGNFTLRALELAVDEARGDEKASVELVDLENLKMNLPGLGETEDVKALQERVAAATGIILATPEYHGSFSSVMKLVIDNLGYPSMLSGKPIALIGVAAGQIGAIKALEHLRSVCSHVGAIVLPGPVSVPAVHTVFDADGKCVDEAVEKRLRGSATRLLDFINSHICPRIALEEMVRSSGRG